MHIEQNSKMTKFPLHMQVTLPENRIITAVKMMPPESLPTHVKKYQMHYSEDCSVWTAYGGGTVLHKYYLCVFVFGSG